MTKLAGSLPTYLMVCLALSACRGQMEVEDEDGADDDGADDDATAEDTVDTGTDEQGTTSPTTTPTEGGPTDDGPSDDGPSDTGDSTAETGTTDPDTTSGTENGDTGDPLDCDPNAPIEMVTAAIEADTTWDCSKRYILTTGIAVRNATLTIEPGTQIFGQAGSYLVVTKTAKLEAEGTAADPIVFTSAQPAGSRVRGDWGGVLLAGNAKINIEGGVDVAEGLVGDDALYGGNDDTHDCGTVRYVRIEFAGFELTMDNELNAFTLYACGTGTTIDHVQTHMGLDDGIEAFGGTVDMKHLVVTGAADDSFDFDQGYTGKTQYVFIQQDPALANYAFEWSNQETNFDATPRTEPWASNITAIGGGDGSAEGSKSACVKLKEGVAGHIYNTVCMGFWREQVELTEEATEMQADAGNIEIMYTLFFDNGLANEGMSLYKTSMGSMFGLQAFVEDDANNNLFGMDPKLGDTTWLNADIEPATDSPLLGAGMAPSDAFFEATDYIGAVNDADWTEGWTAYPAN